MLFREFSLVQWLSCVRLFATPWIAAHQASLPIPNYRSSLKFTSIELVMPSSHLILCHPLLRLPPILPSIRVFSSESALCMRWPGYWWLCNNLQFCCLLLFGHSVVSNSLQPHGLQHPRVPCPSPTSAQTHVHWAGDAIQPSHPLSSPSPFAFSLSQHQLSVL